MKKTKKEQKREEEEEYIIPTWTESPLEDSDGCWIEVGEDEWEYVPYVG